MATVIDVARHAGVSSATVSRVLNGKITVSAEMRDKVQSAVSEMKFQPNPMAQGLRTGQARTVALAVGDIGQRHFAQLTMHVQAALEEIGLDLMLFNLGHSESRLTGFLARAASMRLRGVVLTLSDDIPVAAGRLLDSLQATGIKVVSIGQNLTRRRIPSIVHEERAATARSVARLVERGHSRIAYVGRIGGSAIGTERFRGYKAALTKAGFFSDELVWDKSYRYEAGRDAVLRALDNGIRFTGVQAGSDEIATGAMAALADRGLRVPDDVAVVGFGDVEMGAYLRPALTTLSSHPEAAAAHVRSLFGAQEGGAAEVPLFLLKRTLIERQSA